MVHHHDNDYPVATIRSSGHLILSHIHTHIAVCVYHHQREHKHYQIHTPTGITNYHHCIVKLNNTLNSNFKKKKVVTTLLQGSD